MSNWQYNTPNGIGLPGATQGGGAGGFNAYRSELDAKRSGKLPEAEYPDGYLGTQRSRREDKLMDKVKNRLNDRNYQRGVHVGDKIDPMAYYWPDQFNPQTGLDYEAKGVKWTASGSPANEQLAHNGKVNFQTPAEMGEFYRRYGIDPTMKDIEINTARAEYLKQYLPSWRNS